jgi:class 3 adenylate cyclase/tetratricopeptide (TPR) repeat protein
MVFADVSGFTRLSERLARVGKEGAEHLADAINSCFSVLLADAYAHDGMLLKFGGDALLLWFEGEEHAVRACASAVGMRRTMRRVGRIQTGASSLVLRMSVGVHSGLYETFLVGGSHREYVIAGPAASSVVAMEGIASAGQILVSADTAELLPSSCLGSASGPGVLLARSPSTRSFAPQEKPARPPDELVAECLSTAVRAHVAAPALPEHRTATVAFLQFDKLDELIAERGAPHAAEALDELLRTVQEAADRYQVCLLGSDVAAGGGKLMLSAGAPRAAGDDEERMLLALRQILEAKPRLPVRIGVNRGQAFGGEIGPHYRRTYSVMGDTVNLAARLMAKAPWGTIYATRGVLDRSQTSFHTTAISPFMVKGKIRPVEAWEVGTALRAARPGATDKRLPLVGRDQELALLRRSIVDGLEGKGCLIEIVGETGSGKSRLLTEARELAAGMRLVHATCETYTQNTPYVGWRDPLRQLLGLGWEDRDDVVLERLRAELESSQPELLPWLPLLAIAAGAEAPTTREVNELAPDFRMAKLHDVVLRFLRPALEVPTLVQIEHAHAMDEATAALLRALVTRLESSSWVVIVTRRDVEDGFVAPDGSAVHLLELEPLPREVTLELAEATPEAHLVPPHVLELAVERSGGSPEFLLDLLAAATGGSSALPDSVDGAASARIDALDPGDRVLVRRAAVLGLSFHPRRLRHVLEPDVSDPDEATWKRLAGILARDPDGHVRFKRPALCEVAYDALPFRLRRELHAAVAQALEKDLGLDVDADPAVLSQHFILAGNHERARKYALIGAERAGARFAHADAAQLYRRAIEAGRHDGATAGELAASWEALGQALELSGQLAAATEAVSAARRLVSGDRIAQARLFAQHATVARRAGQLTAAVRWASRGLRALEESRDKEASTWRATLLAALAYIRHHQARLREAERLCRTAITEAEAVGEVRALAHASYVLDLVLFESGREHEAVYSGRSLEIYERLGDLQQQGSVLNNLAFFAYFRWRWDEALELYRRSADCRERAGNPAEIAQSESNIAEILSDRACYEEAEAHQRRAHRVWTSTGERAHAAFASALLGRLAVRTGRYADGLSSLRRASEELHRLGERGYAEFADCLLAEAEAFGGDPREALSCTDRLLGSAGRSQPLLHRVRGIAFVRLDDLPAALRELEISVAVATEQSAQYDLACSLDVLEMLGPSQPGRARERDAILAQLRIEELPKPLLAPAARAYAGAPRRVAAA